jgi:hypothetical protein
VDYRKRQVFREGGGDADRGPDLIEVGGAAFVFFENLALVEELRRINDDFSADFIRTGRSWTWICSRRV